MFALFALNNHMFDLILATAALDKSEKAFRRRKLGHKL